MGIITIEDILSHEEKYLYSILRKDLIPFKKENIKSSDNDFYADAKFIVNEVEDVHPYFLTEYYDLKEYSVQRSCLLDNSKNTDMESFCVFIQKYFKTLCDGHMLFLPLSKFQLNVSFKFSNNKLTLINNDTVITKIGDKCVNKLIKKIKELIYFENKSELEYEVHPKC